MTPTPPLTPDQRAFLDAAERTLGRALVPRWVFAFGDRPDLRDELAHLVAHGEKRGTASLFEGFAAQGEAVPEVGDLSLVLDGAARPVALIVTTRADIVPFDEVTEAFARSEGEGDRTLASWRRDHLAYFTREAARLGLRFDGRSPVLCEGFDVLYTPTAVERGR